MAVGWRKWKYCCETISKSGMKVFGMEFELSKRYQRLWALFPCTIHLRWDLTAPGLCMYSFPLLKCYLCIPLQLKASKIKETKNKNNRVFILRFLATKKRQKYNGICSYYYFKKRIQIYQTELTHSSLFWAQRTLFQRF